MTIFISAGEPSGDLHGANLIAALRARLPEAEFVGFGGPKMSAAGAKLLYPLVNLAVMWFLNVFLNILTFIRLIFRADRYFRDQKPGRGDPDRLPRAALVDRQARQGARNSGVLLRPAAALGLGRLAGQEGAANRGPGAVQPAFRARLVQSARRQSGRVRRPPVSSTSSPSGRLDEAFLAQVQANAHLGPLVAILPGSRTQELTRNLPIMVRAAVKLAQQRPATRFAVACLHERHRVLAEQIINANTSGAEVKSGPGSKSSPHGPPS